MTEDFVPVKSRWDKWQDRLRDLEDWIRASDDVRYACLLLIAVILSALWYR